MVSVRVEIGTGDHAVLVLSPGFPSDPEMTGAGSGSAAVRAQACPAPSSLLVS